MKKRLFLFALVFSLNGFFTFPQNKPLSPAPKATPGAAKKPSPRPSIGTKTPVTARSEAVTLTSPKEKRSYSLGLDLGRNFRQQEIEVDMRLLSKGIQDALAGTKPLLSEKEYTAAMELFRQEMVARQQARLKVMADQNRLEGEQFLSGNKLTAGIVVLPSGLQYKELVAGTGAVPKPTDTVSVHYRGTLINGSEFDNSYKRGEPVSFSVNGVIPGWTEALQLMNVGAKWQLFVPSVLGYGERSPGPEIPPNSTLIFEVELLGIK
jgi:FKBP-type peptidyl-prolyl cis-trans isomerase FklB